MHIKLQRKKKRLSYIKVLYASMSVLNYSENVLYDFATIIGAVGGSLGLFLGFSCFQCGSWIINIAWRKLQTK